jgi:hypothetical protein
MKTIQNSETSIPKIETQDVNSEVEVRIRWMNPDENNHFGYLSGEDFMYYIKRESEGIYNLYKLVNAKRDYMGCFDDLESAQTHAEQLETNFKIRWDDDTFTAHLGYLPGEKHCTYYIFRRNSGAYALYGTSAYEDSHIANFKDLANAKIFAEYVEKSSSTSIDVIMYAQELGRLNEQISN